MRNRISRPLSLKLIFRFPFSIFYERSSEVFYEKGIDKDDGDDIFIVMTTLSEMKPGVFYGTEPTFIEAYRQAQRGVAVLGISGAGPGAEPYGAPGTSDENPQIRE